MRKTILTLIAVSLTIGHFWYGDRAVTPRKADWNDVRAEAIRGGYQLISTDKLWLQYQSNLASLLVVETRQEWEYRSGHILRAVNFPMEPTWLSRWHKKGDLATVLGPGVKREAYSDHLLSEAVQSRKPVIIDFSAAGCAPCRELDETTFHDRDVVKRAARDFVMIKVDLTRRGTPDTERLLEKYAIEIDTIARPKEEYMTDIYFELDLPVAPAAMVGDEIVVEGTDVSKIDLEKVICRHLSLPEPIKKGFFGRNR